MKKNMPHRQRTHLENGCDRTDHDAAAFDLGQERLHVVETHLPYLDVPVCAMLTEFFEPAVIAVPGLLGFAIQPTGHQSIVAQRLARGGRRRPAAA